jgi:hypothetical protein
MESSDRRRVEERLCSVFCVRSGPSVNTVHVEVPVRARQYQHFAFNEKLNIKDLITLPIPSRYGTSVFIIKIK